MAKKKFLQVQIMFPTDIGKEGGCFFIQVSLPIGYVENPRGDAKFHPRKRSAPENRGTASQIKFVERRGVPS
jgi:hypothetical protein